MNAYEVCSIKRPPDEAPWSPDGIRERDRCLGSYLARSRQRSHLPIAGEVEVGDGVGDEVEMHDDMEEMFVLDDANTLHVHI